MASNAVYNHTYENVLFDPDETANCRFKNMRVREITKKRGFDAIWIVALSVVVNCVVVGVFSYLLINKRVENLLGNDIGRQNRNDESTEMKQLNFSQCGTWKPYKDEKCFKIIDEMKTYAEAEKLCRQADSSATLLSIGSLEEQTFVENLIFNQHSVVDVVWFQPEFIEGSIAQYSNWAGDSAHFRADVCAQMMAVGSTRGKWTSVPCNKKNLVVCQKLQSWTHAHFQQAYINTRQELEALKLKNAGLSEQLATELKDLKTEKLTWQSDVHDLKEKLQTYSIPIGFVYVQLPKEMAPAEIWPTLTWTDVSSTYAGVFFRVEGGDAAVFGNKQNDSSPRLTGVKYGDRGISGNGGPIETKLGDWSDWIITAGYDGHWNYHSFKMSSGEVRPVNMAMRVWKRTN